MTEIVLTAPDPDPGRRRREPSIVPSRVSAAMREYLHERAVRRGLPHEQVIWLDDPLLGRIVQVEGLRRAFVARILGPDPKYHYQREFLGERRRLSTGGRRIWVVRSSFRLYDTIEIGIDDWQAFCLWTGEAIEPIAEMDLRRALASSWRTWTQQGGAPGTRALAVE